MDASSFMQRYKLLKDFCRNDAASSMGRLSFVIVPVMLFWKFTKYGLSMHTRSACVLPRSIS